jgi:hypothetical protein
LPHSEPPLLDGEKVLETIAVLRRRIDERFPECGLSMVVGRLHRNCARSRGHIEWLERPIMWLRVAVAVLTGILAAGLLIAVWNLLPLLARLQLVEVVGALESAINEAVYVALALLFAWGYEVRLKRKRALAEIHELRSLAHIIDMHQLTKDPDRIVHPAPTTESSPKRTMSPPELCRYLDYCSEALALTGKVAVLYIQHFDDATVLASANEVELLTTHLSCNIWQKLMILEGLPPETVAA